MQKQLVNRYNVLFSLIVTTISILGSNPNHHTNQPPAVACLLAHILAMHQGIAQPLTPPDRFALAAFRSDNGHTDGHYYYPNSIVVLPRYAQADISAPCAQHQNQWRRKTITAQNATRQATNHEICLYWQLNPRLPRTTMTKQFSREAFAAWLTNHRQNGTTR